MFITHQLRQLGDIYMNAKQHVIKNGFVQEIDWQEDLEFEQIDEHLFLKEVAWVILSSGMKESIIRGKFSSISKEFYYWASSSLIVNNKEKCLKRALRHFNNKNKMSAIINIAIYLHTNGFEKVKKSIIEEGIAYLQSFPYMGPATSFHLAKNLGLNVAKPDRHLKRIADKAGYDSVDMLCADIARVTGEKVSVVDLVLWRYATLDNNYLECLIVDRK